ncbi:hypothetical protein CLOM_g3756 [Closterium sp. NIES-68]|nr:hypothetical protein CLOM_g3756 [Closterium sp. NIES-68]
MGHLALRVALDGSAPFSSIQDAVDAVPPGKGQPTTIHIDPGTYFEQILVPSSKHCISFVGTGPPWSTIVCFDAFNGKARPPHAQCASDDRTNPVYNTYNCATVQVEASGVVMVNIVIVNQSRPDCGGQSGQNQAVALRTTGDKVQLHGCWIRGWQATLYTHQGRQYFSRTVIEGSVDIIFGGPNVNAFFHKCSILSKGRGTFTTHYRDLTTSPHDAGAFVFQCCAFTGTSSTNGPCYLGRPWRQDARVILAHCYIGQCVPQRGWDRWDGSTDISRPTFWEFDCVGPGSIKAHSSINQTSGQDRPVMMTSPSAKSPRFIGREPAPAEVAPFLDLPSFFALSRTDCSGSAFPGPAPPCSANEDGPLGTPLPPLQEASPPSQGTSPSPAAPTRLFLVVPAAAEDGNSARVQEAIDAVEPGGKHTTVIAVFPGTYFEQVRIPSNKTRILLRPASVEEGSTGVGEVRIVFNAHTGKAKHDSSSSSGSAGGKIAGGETCSGTIATTASAAASYTTYTSATFAVEADHFTAEGIVFENTAGPRCGGGSGQHQAVAVRVTAERSAFHRCCFLGWQDTLYLHRGSTWFKDCRVEGSVDFIFGGPKARGYWKGCEVVVRGKGWVTAHRRDLAQWPDDTDGAFVFDACSIQASDPSVPPSCALLGRPWGPDARVLLHGCSIGAVVKAEGWGAWNSATDVSRPRFLEWECTGPGASLAHDGRPPYRR